MYLVPIISQLSCKWCNGIRWLCTKNDMHHKFWANLISVDKFVFFSFLLRWSDAIFFVHLKVTQSVPSQPAQPILFLIGLMQAQFSVICFLISFSYLVFSIYLKWTLFTCVFAYSQFLSLRKDKIFSSQSCFSRKLLINNKNW